MPRRRNSGNACCFFFRRLPARLRPQPEPPGCSFVCVPCGLHLHGQWRFPDDERVRQERGGAQGRWRDVGDLTRAKADWWNATMPAVSFPVQCCQPRSILECAAYQFVFCPHYLSLAAKAQDPVERLKNVTAAFIACIHTTSQVQLLPAISALLLQSLGAWVHSSSIHGSSIHGWKCARSKASGARALRRGSRHLLLALTACTLLALARRACGCALRRLESTRRRTLVLACSC